MIALSDVTAGYPGKTVLQKLTLSLPEKGHHAASHVCIGQFPVFFQNG